MTVNHSQFVNLHVHTDYSILDGAGKPSKYADYASSQGQFATAKTDHGTMGGSYAFFQAYRAKGLTPIIGCEFYVAPEHRGVQKPVFWGSPEQRSDDVSRDGAYLHLTLLAVSAVGVRNLYRLQHLGHTEGFYYVPRIDLELLGEYAQGIVCLTGCPSGAIQTAIRLGQWSRATDYAQVLRDIFPGALYVELMDHGLEIEQRVRGGLVQLAGDLNLPMVATADSHFVEPGDSDSHDSLLCVQTKKRKSANNRFRFSGTGYHLATHSDMAALFSEIPTAITNSVAIAERVEDCGEAFAPRVRFPRYSDNEELDLERLVLDGLSSRVGHSEIHVRQANYETSVINSAGYAGYFLNLKRIVDEWRKNDIRVGPGRGSAGGSVVAYSLGITDLDPIEHKLLFERFLNPERISRPDIDIDIDDRKRDHALQIVCSLYGEDRVAHVNTYGMMGAKSAIRDSVKILGHSYQMGSDLVAMLPPAKFGRQPTLADLPKNVPHRAVIETARQIEGFIRSVGTHASAIVVSPDDLIGLVPTRIARPPKDQPSKPAHMVIEMSGEELDELGFVKYDCLGLSNLGVIDECLRLLGATSGESSQLVVSTPYESRDLPALPTTYDDPRTFELLSSGKTAGVFQLEGYGMRALLNRVRPTTFADVAAVLALYRPGPMGANAHNEYADRKNGKAIVEYPHPELRATLADVLSSTYGLVVYQEQVLEVLKVVGGYTYGTAGLIFDAMRKKNTAKMLEAEPDFHERMKNNGYSREASTALWDVLVPFSDYSFGKAHSYGYATISYWTGWLKANHPIEFYAALLSAETDPDKLAGYIRSAVEDDITLFPPDVNVSGYGWTLTKGGIRFGIAAIKGMSEKTYKALIGSRPYISMDDFWTRVPSKFLNIGVLTAATKSGLFDSLDPNREQILANLESTTKRALSNREAAKKGQHPLWKGYSVLPGLRRLGDRQLWEEEVLGISLTKRAVNIRLRRTMDTHEFEYLKSIFDRNPGGQPVNISLGDLTTLKRVARIALTDRALLGFEALGVTVTEEE